MKDIDLQEVQHVYVGVWSSDRRAGMGGLVEWVDGWMGGFAKVDNVFWVDCLLMCTEMVSSIVMYNLGVGHGGPYISANLEGTPR